MVWKFRPLAAPLLVMLVASVLAAASRPVTLVVRYAAAESAEAAWTAALQLRPRLWLLVEPVLLQFCAAPALMVAARLYRRRAFVNFATLYVVAVGVAAAVKGWNDYRFTMMLSSGIRWEYVLTPAYEQIAIAGALVAVAVLVGSRRGRRLVRLNRL